MPTKKTAIYRTDLLPHRMNAGKEAKVCALMKAWRQTAVAQAREQWRLVFTTGRPSKRHDVSRTGYDVLGTSYDQLHLINRWQAWYDPKVLTMKDGTPIPPEVRRLARTVMRHVLTRHRKPNLRLAGMIVDQRCIALRRRDMPLSARWMSCDCGNEMDRDENAARNLYAYREELETPEERRRKRARRQEQGTAAMPLPVPVAECEFEKARC
ncbi:MAG: hypothetical protein HS122_19330 [Opitutaceae bacterium]|nr:hypothetical protein [Opitutaceae bacterium]